MYIKFVRQQVLVILLLMAPYAARAGVLQFREASDVLAKSKIRVSDLATCHQCSTDTNTRLRTLVLGNAPDANSELILTSAALSQSLQKLSFQLKPGELQIIIPGEVRVRALVSKDLKEEIQKELSARLGEICRGCSFDYKELVFPAIDGDVTEFEMAPLAQLPLSIFQLPIIFRNKDRSETKAMISGRLRVHKKIPHLLQNVSFGQKIEEQNLSWRLEEVRERNQDLALSENSTKSVYATRSLLAGQILRRTDVRGEAVVRMGQNVRIVSLSGGLEVTADGVAQQNGFVGDSIRVQIQRSKKILIGWVRNEGLVEIQ